ncbi:PREDICTED: splicing regulatory glutamine/lysine-rich protein 1-like isoform X2 [Amphimedon queenslandica]|uniref:CHHC U11-48K-type domain-containing protein n=1 Tax=Amphimedon queenslandica TaxID=400682 RepID=A0AAN0J9V0_AMPQE|nr:PREDICTED: splicing regulatory glutamine/lysine-rich protein 1-like isoform X2 [Amphimedon queenslandica]|eukprot:XP_019853506.1 PREDICTED: splicing regulatory glutamine/lysine-rich protein 1-like isoform X2 [Amphimedon queenslandica]
MAAMDLEKLSLFIKEKRQEIDEIMSYVGLKKEKLNETMPKLVPCTYNHHHYVPEESRDAHLKRCPYNALGMKPNEIQIFLDQLDFSDPNNEPVIIDSSISEAVQQFILNKRKESSLIPPHATHNKFSSLEGGESKKEILESNDPILLIRYIKSWTSIPRVFCQLVPTGIHPVPLKAWLFRNIPEYHSYKHEMSGDLHIVDTVMYQFNLTPNLTPDQLVGRLTPYLFGVSRSFVLSLWKFLSILKVQQEHNIADKTVEDLLPLQTEDGKPVTSLVSQIKMLASEVSTLPSLPLPMSSVLSSAEEKRVLYDYVVELGKELVGDSKDYLQDSDLFRDDAKILLAQSRGRRDEEGKSHLAQIKEMRDVKRRRASYRAKNVHITQKPIKQVFHEIIAARTEELRELWEEAHGVGNKNKNEKDDKDIQSEDRRSPYSRSRQRRISSQYRSHERERSRSRGRNRNNRSRSRDRKRRKQSRSRERRSRSRHRSRSHERRSKSREKRSRSREKRSRSRHREHSHRSRSRSKEREKSKHHGKSKSEHKSSSHKHKHKHKT